MKKYFPFYSFILSVFCICTLLSNVVSAQYTVQTIPNPKKNGQNHFVSNPDNILTSTEVDSINAICASIQNLNTVEIAVVIVKDYVDEEVSSFTLKLFNHWKIGTKEKKNGLLLFVSTVKRAYWFSTGSGSEGVLTDVLLARIGKNEMLPHFKNGKFGTGIISALQKIETVVSSPESIAELYSEASEEKDEPVVIDIFSILGVLGVYALLFYWIHRIENKHSTISKKEKKSLNFTIGCLSLIGFVGLNVVLFIFWGKIDDYFVLLSTIILGSCFLLFKYFIGRGNVLASYKDKVNAFDHLKAFNKEATFPMLFSPLILLFFVRDTKKYKEASIRKTPPDDSGDWIRINRDETKNVNKFLSEGQRKEEKSSSKNYEIWVHSKTNDIRTIAFHGTQYKNFHDCPKCNFHTYQRSYIKTIVEPTYSRKGQGVRTQSCVYCQFSQTFETVSLAKLVDTSSSTYDNYSSSSSSDSWSSSSSSSSSEGSWGGGSSSGGGAGGYW